MAGVVISEFLADNENGVADEAATRSDWIELRNTDAAFVDITGCFSPTMRCSNKVATPGYGVIQVSI